MLCRIGEVEVWRILEIHAPFLTPEELYPTAGPDVRDIVEKHVPGGTCPETGRLILPVQGFLLKTPSHVILVDSCVGNDKTVPRMPDWHQRSDNRFMAALTAAGVAPTDVDYVLCTHLHTDHIGWNTQLIDGRWVPTFPKARYLMPSADEEMLRGHDGAMYTESVLPVVAAGQAELVQAGHMLGDHVTLIPTPGHTPGHVSVLVQSDGCEAIITGDALHSTAQCYHPEWHFKFDADGAQAAVSRRQLLETAAETGRTVLGSHFALPSIGRVKAQGDAFAWEER
ncbi:MULTISPECIES: MBL fold metallo-hydrolase [unclassified Roseovarius]|uniref:MBL fold metallo-hydrolase n=1 Tax=unclassified Roseovarius TaxID=2614913 RepID=UPI00273D40B9|nr:MULTISPECIES: MBL fold metallo-hydrolase [unclassified Roseovarius]